MTEFFGGKLAAGSRRWGDRFDRPKPAGADFWPRCWR